ncbi:MAG: hypothetical protein GF365_05055 [Candidatus Buchananbacteria bacterium]|nr:hypothetical protein [Candidatus Buchananbacteria bacterium]
MANLETLFSHIFIHYYSNKSSSTCKLFISEPNKNQEDKMGRLFGILEINTPSRENASIITQLINYLEDAYYSKAEKDKIDIETAFEQSLEEANQKFQQILQEKQFYLVGNLNEFTIKEKINLVVGVIKNKQVNLSYLNNIGVFLVHKTKQDHKLVDIKKFSKEEKKKEATDEKTSKIFDNILKGEVNPDDFLFLANSSFLNYVSLERIQKTITSLPPHKSAEYFKNSLLQHEGNNFAAIIIKNSRLQVNEPNDSPPLTSITELNYTETSTEKLLAPSIWAGIKTVSIIAVNFIKKGKNSKLLETTAQKIKNDKKSKKITQTPKTEEETLTEAEKIEKLNKSSEPAQVSSKSNFIAQLKLLKTIKSLAKKIFIKIKNLFHNLASRSPQLAKKLHNLKKYLRLKLAYLGNYFKKIPNLSKILLIIAFLLIILFVYSTSYFKHKQTQEVYSQEFQNNVSQIEEKINQAESNIIFGDEEKANNEIKQAQELLAELNVESTKQKEKMQSLNQSIESIIAKLRHITNINDPIIISDLSSQQENNININNIIYNDNLIFAFDSINNNSYVINLDNREVNKIYSNLSDIGKIVKAKQIEDRILIYHDQPGFIEFKNNKFIPLNVALKTNAKITAFADYYNRLYTVDINNNQIYRQPKADSGYAQGTAWLNETIDLKSINSIGIDTNIWALTSDGQILKLNKGRKQNFNIKGLEPRLKKTKQLFTGDETNYLYIMEPINKRLVVLDKEGTLITQYFSPQFDNLKGFTISESEKKIFIINDNKILFFNLNHI